MAVDWIWYVVFSLFTLFLIISVSFNKKRVPLCSSNTLLDMDVYGKEKHVMVVVTYETWLAWKLAIRTNSNPIDGKVTVE